MFFLFLYENMCYGEALLISTHNMFSWRNKKNIYLTPSII